MRAKSSQFGAKYLSPSPLTELELGAFELDPGSFDESIDHFRIHPELQESRRNVVKQAPEEFNPPARVCDVARDCVRIGSRNVACNSRAVDR